VDHLPAVAECGRRSAHRRKNARGILQRDSDYHEFLVGGEEGCADTQDSGTGPNMRTNPNVNPLLGFLAGAVAGLAASLIMSRFHSLLQKVDSASQPIGEDSTVKAASAISRTIFRCELTPKQKEVAGAIMHYGFGTSLGALYGTAVEFDPSLRTGWGMPFGVAAWLGAHVIAVPVLGLSDPITKSARRNEAVELGAHLVYGAAAESLRRLMRAPTFVG
jgi:putative membrane protein